MSISISQELNDEALQLPFELDTAIACGIHGAEEQERYHLISEVATELRMRVVNRAVPGYRLDMWWKKAQQGLGQRLKDFRYSQMIDSFQKNTKELQELGKKLKDKDLLKRLAGPDESEQAAIVEQKKRKRLEEVEHKLEELDTLRKKIRLSIFGKATSSSETAKDENVVVQDLTTAPAHSDALAVTGASKTPTDLSTRPVPSISATNVEFNRKGSDSISRHKINLKTARHDR